MRKTFVLLLELRAIGFGSAAPASAITGSYVKDNEHPFVGLSSSLSSSSAADCSSVHPHQIEEFVLREELIMPTAAELDVENCQPTDFREPRRVYAWIRYFSKAIRIQAHGIAYTRTAVKTRFLEPSVKIQREDRVWLSTVTSASDNGTGIYAKRT